MDVHLNSEVAAPPVVRHLSAVPVRQETPCLVSEPVDLLGPDPRTRTSRRMRVRGRWRPGMQHWRPQWCPETPTTRFASLSSSTHLLYEPQSSCCSMSAVLLRYAAKIGSLAATSSADSPLEGCFGSGFCGQGGHPGVRGATFASRSASAALYVPLGSVPSPQPASVTATRDAASPLNLNLVTRRHTFTARLGGQRHVAQDRGRNLEAGGLSRRSIGACSRREAPPNTSCSCGSRSS